MSSNAPATIKSKRNRKARGRRVLNFRMFSPKARRITLLVTIPTGVARHFYQIFLGAVAASLCRGGQHRLPLEHGDRAPRLQRFFRVA